MPAHIKVPNFGDQSAQDLYANVVADVLRIRQARENYAVVLEKVEQLPQLFLGA